MNTVLQAQIERLLLDRRDWVSTEELCSMFCVKERQLRQTDDEPGLCSSFAISRTSHGGGFKHIHLATREEWICFKHKKRKHGISELRNTAYLDKERSNATRFYHCIEYQRDTGQGLLPMEVPCRRTF